MKHSTWIVTLSLAAVIGLAGTASAKPKACDPAAVEAAIASIDEACACDGGWKNHGQYVKCVTRAKKSAAREAGLSNKCLNGAMSCAARSSCGTVGEVDCSVTTAGVCSDANPGDEVAEGTCDLDGAACDTDADCAGESTCEVAESSEACATAGGTAVGIGCCQ